MSFPTGWTYRQPITIDNTTANGGGVFALANFQVQLALTAGNFAFASANANGSDLVATSDSAGSTILNYWLGAYNSTVSTGTLWVEIPSLATGATTTIYLWYGNSAQTVSLGSYSATMTKLVEGSGVTELYHCDDGTGSSLAEAGSGTAATVVGGPPTWEAVDGGAGYVATRYLTVASPTFTETGAGWTGYNGTTNYGYGGYQVITAGSGSGANTCQWSIAVPPGTYNVSAFWGRIVRTVIMFRTQFMMVRRRSEQRRAIKAGSIRHHRRVW